MLHGRVLNGVVTGLLQRVDALEKRVRALENAGASQIDEDTERAFWEEEGPNH